MNSQLGNELSWIFSIISNVVFLIVFLPQCYKNYLNKSGESISLVLLFCLIIGDILSMVSGYVLGVPIVIIFSAIYHIVLDIMVILQILYYRKQMPEFSSIDEITPLITDEEFLLDDYITIISYFELIFISMSSLCVIMFCILLNIFNNDKKIILANIIAWLATFLFIGSRIPQIILNYKTNSVKGLSIWSFILINVCNLFFFLSIVINLYDINPELYYNFIINNLQWLVGCTCTFIFDVIIFYQFVIYK